MSEWISVEDQLPNEDQYVFTQVPLPAHLQRRWFIGLARWQKGEWRGLDPTFAPLGVKHWIPMPEPPEYDNNYVGEQP